MIDASKEFEGEKIFSFPTCPLCDNNIMDWDLAIIVTANGSKCLAHEICTEELT